MKTILIAGGTGLVGSYLSQLLLEKGYEVRHLSRKSSTTAQYPTFKWDIQKGFIEEAALEGVHYIINLAGSGIADKRWTEERKKDIIDSRIESTRLLKKYIQEKKNTIEAYISASAIGYYGERGDEILTEDAPKGRGFLAQSTVAWENAINEVAQTGIRTVAIRIGIVLSTEGGALEKMLIPFMFRAGVYFGSGKQWYSWIHIEDICNMFIWAIENPHAQGYYNGVAPTPLSNFDLTQAISNAKGGGYIIAPTPAWSLKMTMGEMADVVLNSTRVSAQKVIAEGFKFKFPEAEMALRDLFERKI